MRSNSWIALGTFVYFSAIICFGAEIYVSPAGNDGTAGTLAAPLATLAAARDKADQRKAGNTPVTVYLRGGTYYLTAPVVFGPANSGTATAPIVYTAYGAEKPVLSGGIKLPDTLTWAVSSGQIKVTTIAPNLKIDQLFLNGKRQLLARFPNFDSTKILDGYDANCMSTARVATWKTPVEGPGYVRALHQNMWGSNSFTITGKNADNTLVLKWSGDNNNGNGMHPTYRMVENIFEELDAPGEWYYRKATGQLYFYPPAGTNLSTAKIEFASQDELIRVVGTSTTSTVQYLTFKGLTFTHTYRTLFSKPYESLLRGDWTIARAGTMFITNSENIRVENCFFDQIGGNGIFISAYNRKHVIFNNNFIDGGATCVAICGLMTAVRCPRASTCTDKAPGPLTNDYPAFITVENNTMNHFGRFEKQPAGVNISMSQCDTVRHNTIHDCPRAGINFTDGCWGGHEIEYNWVYRAVLETGDHGPFNAWGRDRNFSFGAGLDSSLTKLDAVLTTNIHNNRFESAPPLFGIDLDDGSSNYNVHDNLCIGVGLKLWHTRQNRYVNNIVVRGGLTEFHDTYTNSGHYYAHNIIVDTCVYSFCCFADMSSGAIPGEVKSRVIMVDSNCIYSGPPAARVPKMVQWTQRNTVTTTWATWLAAGLDAHSALADPLFTDTNKTWPNYAPKGDFTVQAGSPAAALGFKNFPMDSFGVMQVPSVAAQNPFIARGVDGSGTGRFVVRYHAGRLVVLNNGDYQVTVTTALGRMVRVFNGKGDSDFNIDAKIMGAGIYFAVVRAKNGVETKRFIIN